MQYVEWCDLFLIGHPTIDKQHKKLLEIVNRFHNEAKNGFNRKLTIEILQQLINYAQKHFITEEAILEKWGMSEDILSEHKGIHEGLIMDIFELNEKIASGSISSMCELEKFLTEWIVLHILTEDKKFKTHLMEINSGMQRCY